jgi:MinD-like ATPase involved in chromosome partitioning or flagellar assembly
VGIVGAGDEVVERQLRQLGVEHLIPHDGAPERLAAAVLAAIGVSDGAHVVAPDPPLTQSSDVDGASEEQTPSPAELGQVVAIWGPVGAPGRSTVAVNLASELCALGHPVLLIDADTYGGVVAQLLGVLDEAPGLAAACRLANQGVLDAPRLANVASELRPGLRLLTGISRPDRWPEIRPAALEMVVAISRQVAAFTVIDCGFCLEEDEELSYDTAAPRRNGATVTALTVSDVVIGVTAADPVGLARYVRALPDCAAVVEPVRPLTVANRLRKGVTGPGDPRRAVRAALSRYAGLSDVLLIPEDRDAIDAAMSVGRTLTEVAPRSAARKAIRDLAARLAAP